MKSHAHLKDLDKWIINYVTYVDTLRLFDSRIYKKTTDDLRKVNYKGFSIVYEKPYLTPILFEMRHASQYIGDIDNMDKKHIIQSIERLVEKA